MSGITDGSIRHYDPDQLLFQLHEVYERRVYLRHGITIRPEATVLDVGANVGVSSIFFAQQGAGSVHAFEPIPVLYELLAENLRPHAGCVAHPFGAGSENAQEWFSFYPRAAAMSSRYADPERDAEAVRKYMANAGFPEDEDDPQLVARFEREEILCELRPLSRVIADERIGEIDLLKVDVERSERDVLAGLSNSNWDQVRQVIIEVHDEDGRCAEIERLLRDRGFSVVDDQDREWKETDLRMLYGVRDGR